MDQQILTPCEECRSLLAPDQHEFLIAHFMLVHALSQELAEEQAGKMLATLQATA